MCSVCFCVQYQVSNIVESATLLSLKDMCDQDLESSEVGLQKCKLVRESNHFKQQKT